MNQTYSTLRELGRGASGVVTLVRRRKDGRLFAAKEIDLLANGGSMEASTMANQRRQVLDEVNLMLGIPQHPSVVALEEVVESRTSITLVLEYVPQGTLHDLLYGNALSQKKKTHLQSVSASASNVFKAKSGGDLNKNPLDNNSGLFFGDSNFSNYGDTTSTTNENGRGHDDEEPLPPPREESEIVAWLSQLVNAMEFIHNQGIIHRDLKLQNILVASEGRIVKVSDFGVATSLIRHGVENMATTVVGTPHYMSPEVMEGKAYNNRSDVWSLGVVAYELCNRRLPFDASNVLALAHQIMDKTPDRLDAVYSDGLNSLVQAMLRKDASSRPSMKQCAQMVKNYRRGVDVFSGVTLGGTDERAGGGSPVQDYVPPPPQQHQQQQHQQQQQQQQGFTSSVRDESPQRNNNFAEGEYLGRPFPDNNATPQQVDNGAAEMDRGRSRNPRSKDQVVGGSQRRDLSNEERKKLFEESRLAAAANKKKLRDQRSPSPFAVDEEPPVSQYRRRNSAGGNRANSSGTPTAEPNAENLVAGYSPASKPPLAPHQNINNNQQDNNVESRPTDGDEMYSDPGDVGDRRDEAEKQAAALSLADELRLEMEAQRKQMEQLMPPTPRITGEEQQQQHVQHQHPPAAPSSLPNSARHRMSVGQPIDDQSDVVNTTLTMESMEPAPPFTDPNNLRQEDGIRRSVERQRSRTPSPPPVAVHPPPPPPHQLPSAEVSENHNELPANRHQKKLDFGGVPPPTKGPHSEGGVPNNRVSTPETQKVIPTSESPANYHHHSHQQAQQDVPPAAAGKLAPPAGGSATATSSSRETGGYMPNAVGASASGSTSKAPTPPAAVYNHDETPVGPKATTTAGTTMEGGTQTEVPYPTTTPPPPRRSSFGVQCDLGDREPKKKDDGCCVVS